MSTTSESRHTSCTPAQTLLQRPAACGRCASPCSCCPPPDPSALPSPADRSAASGPPHSPCAGSPPVQQQTSTRSASPTTASLPGKPFYLWLHFRCQDWAQGSCWSSDIWSPRAVTLSAKMHFFSALSCKTCHISERHAPLLDNTPALWLFS